MNEELGNVVVEPVARLRTERSEVTTIKERHSELDSLRRPSVQNLCYNKFMNDVKTVKLSDVCEIVTGNTPSTKNENYYSSNDIPFVKPSDLPMEYISTLDDSEFHISEKARSIARILPKRSVLVSCIGIIGKIGINTKEVAFNQQINGLIPNANLIDYNYLANAIISKKRFLSDKANAAVVPIINKTNFSNLQIPLPPLQTQKQIAARLDLCTDTIAKHKKLLELHETLIKSQFVKMFGDPVTNPMGWEKERLDSVAEIKIGPFGSLLHAEDYTNFGHALVNPMHIVNGKISKDKNLFVSDEKYKELFPYQLKKNDIVMGRRGEMGRCAVVDEEGLLCGTGCLIIRMKGEVEPCFIQNTISFPSYKKSIENKSVGTTMQNLNVPIVSSFEIIKPPRKMQDDFSTFVQQVEKSKSAVQASLQKAETLYKALMQKYFG